MVHPFLPCRGAFYPGDQSAFEEKKPFLLCDGRIPATLQKALSFYGQVVLLPPHALLPSPVAGHADMLSFYDGEILYTYLDYYNDNFSLFEKLPCSVVPLELPVGEYPLDLQLDQLLFRGTLIGREEFVPSAIKKGRRILSVKQGYAKCSTLVFGENLITADRGIAAAGRVLCGNVLEIKEGFIDLPGYNTGFIGGASGVIGDKVLFFGSPHAHPSGREMVSFIKEAGFEVVSLLAAPLCDYGGLVVI